MAAGFHMYGDPVCARFCKIFQVLIRIFYHQMDIKRDIRNFPHSGNNQRTDCDIGYKVTIHNIHMDKIGSALYNVSYIFTQSGKISRQNRRRYHVFLHFILRRLG